MELLLFAHFISLCGFNLSSSAKSLQSEGLLLVYLLV